MCDAWQDDFTTFVQDVGERPSSRHSLDRIDNDGGYEPGNVRWATAKEQAENRGRMTEFVQEIDRLRRENLALLAEVEAWRAIGRAIADGRLYYSDQPQGWHCVLCNGWTPDQWNVYPRGPESESDRAKRVIWHEPDCPVTIARTLLNPA